MRIRVTQQEIDEGVQGNIFHCPAARAIRRLFKSIEVWVRETIISASFARSLRFWFSSSR
jgi:hypothetical protein